jgi:hypothetical protein
VVARSDWFEGGTRDISGPANKNATEIAYFFKEWPVSIAHNLFLPISVLAAMILTTAISLLDSLLVFAIVSS